MAGKHTTGPLMSDMGASRFRDDSPARHRQDTPPMSAWAESRRGYMSAATVAANAALHARDTGTPFAGWSAPGVAL